MNETKEKLNIGSDEDGLVDKVYLIRGKIWKVQQEFGAVDIEQQKRQIYLSVYYTREENPYPELFGLKSVQQEGRSELVGKSGDKEYRVANYKIPLNKEHSIKNLQSLVNELDGVECILYRHVIPMCKNMGLKKHDCEVCDYRGVIFREDLFLPADLLLKTIINEWWK